jgi:hypothetical protein
MEKMTVIALLEKYWQAETTLEDEKTLAGYFNGEAVDPELEGYRELFVYFQEEGRIMPSADLGDRILEHIGIAPRVRVIRPFGAGLLSAAAVIAAIVIGLFLVAPGARHATPNDAGNALATIRHGAIQDTYDDPEQALAAVRRALLVASTHLNQGRQELIGDHK